MLSPKLKWPQETSCIPNSTLQPIRDQRTRSALGNQVTHLFLILNAQSTITEPGQCIRKCYRPVAVPSGTFSIAEINEPEAKPEAK